MNASAAGPSRAASCDLRCRTAIALEQLREAVETGSLTGLSEAMQVASAIIAEGRAQAHAANELEAASRFRAKQLQRLSSHVEQYAVPGIRMLLSRGFDTRRCSVLEITAMASDYEVPQKMEVRDFVKAQLTLYVSSEMLAARGVAIPHHFQCSITHDIMVWPVRTSDGQVYERQAITCWLSANATSPLTGMPLVSLDLTSDWDLREEILAFVRQHKHKQATVASNT